jgi:hypothetical protein
VAELLDRWPDTLDDLQVIQLQRTAEHLNDMLQNAGPSFKMHDATTWPRQAGLLADGKWAEFKTLTDALVAGRD